LAAGKLMSAAASSPGTRPSTQILVRLLEADKSYGSLHVLNRLSLEVRRGEHVVLIGPSGSGKTTVLRCLMTLEHLDAGTIEIDGDTLEYHPRRPSTDPQFARQQRLIRQKVGMVFQQFNLFPHMTALANVTLAPCRVLRLSRSDAEAQASELLGLVGLGDKLHAYPYQLSGGQQQRVAIARALAMRPKVMLFDEVTSALDPELVGEVLKVIRRLAHDTGMTMLIVTHEMEFAAEIGDRVVFMEHGQVIEDSPPGVIFKAPVNERTRQFLRALRDR